MMLCFRADLVYLMQLQKRKRLGQLKRGGPAVRKKTEQSNLPRKRSPKREEMNYEYVHLSAFILSRLEPALK